MNYKLRDKTKKDNMYYSEIEGNALDYLLKIRGVENVDELLNVSEKDEYHWSMLSKVDEVSDFLINNTTIDTVIAVLNDNDVDGITSTVLNKGYLEEAFGCKVEIIFHGENKKHGINKEEFLNIEENDEIMKRADIFIVPDAGVSDYEGIKFIKEHYNVPVLIHDHHELGLDEFPVETLEEAIKIHPADFVVNPQICDYPNKQISGVGVSYKILQALDEKLGKRKADKYLPYVAMGMVGDRMDLTSLETRYIVLKGIEKLKAVQKLFVEDRIEYEQDEFLKELTKSLNGYKFTDYSIDAIGWKVAPIMNAIARVGTRQENKWLIEAMCGSDETLVYQGRRSKGVLPPPETRSVQQEIIRKGANCRGKQKRWENKLYKSIKEDIEEKELYNNKVIIIDATEYFTEPLQKRLSGLVANTIAIEYCKPTLVLKADIDDFSGSYEEGDRLVTGSLRNFNNSPIERFKDDLNNNTNIWAGGHQSAAGVKVNMSTLDDDLEKLNKLYEEYEMASTYIVDFVTRLGRIEGKDIIDIAKCHDVFGGNLDKPRFAVKAIIDTDSDIDLKGSRVKILKIDKKNCVDLIKFHGSSSDIKKIKGLKEKGFNKTSGYRRADLTLICEADINEWQGDEIPQLIIQDYSVKEYKVKGKRKF